MYSKILYIHIADLNSTTILTQEIEKETIPLLSFPKVDVLENDQARGLRISEIERAMRLGNGSKHKVKIVFEDAEGIKTVHTTVWGVTQNRIVLKRGDSIPVHRIHKITFY